MSKTDLSAFPTNDERDALLLEFQRLSARLVRAGLMSRVSATRWTRSVNQERTKAEALRYGLPKLVLEIFLCIDDGTLREGEHFVRGKGGLIALHLESVARAMFRADRGRQTAREMRRIFHFGWLHFRHVVVARSERMMFGPEEDRRRTVVLDVARAQVFVGNRPPAVPSR